MAGQFQHSVLRWQRRVCLKWTKLSRIIGRMPLHNLLLQRKQAMNAPYRHEQLIPASRGTAEVNLAILWSQAASEGRHLTAEQSSAAIRIALKLGLLARGHASRRITP
jgi:hypothetical protein